MKSKLGELLPHFEPRDPKPSGRLCLVSAGQPNGLGEQLRLQNLDHPPIDVLDLAGLGAFEKVRGGLTDPHVFEAGPIITPGESIVFLEGLAPADFRTGWGDSNRPPALQIVTYSGSGLSFRITGDTLFLWDNASTDPSDTVDRADFGIADTGVTFNYDPVTRVFGARSVLGVNGVITAAAAPDIGSPGRIVAPNGTAPPPSPPSPQLRVLGGTARDSIRIEFEAIAGYRYSLESTDDFNGGNWSATGDSFQPTTNAASFFEKERATSARFYRLRTVAAPQLD